MRSNYQIIPLDVNSWRIEEENVRCFLFAGTERALLVDSGCTIDCVREIAESLTSLPIQLVNTHTDFDHTACNRQFSQVSMHPAEYALYRSSHVGCVPLSPLWEHDILDLGGRRFEVILIPGHTPGSIALLDRENRILVGGDSVQDGRIFLFGPARSLTAYLHSLEKLAALKPCFDQVYASHSSFQVPGEIIYGLIHGVKEMLKGNICGVPSFYLDTPILEYAIGVATILHEHDAVFPE